MPKQGLVQNSERLATAPKMGLKKDPKEFVPKGYTLFQQYKGDLNKDGKPDVVLMIKGTDKSKWVDDENRGRLDRNRRGLIILFKRKNGYEQILRNDTCFSSENEDGGIYDAPELELYIIKNTLKSSRLFPLSYLFQKNQYKCDIVPSLPTGLCGIEPVEHAPV